MHRKRGLTSCVLRTFFHPFADCKGKNSIFLFNIFIDLIIHENRVFRPPDVIHQFNSFIHYFIMYLYVRVDV